MTSGNINLGSEGLETIQPSGSPECSSSTLQQLIAYPRTFWKPKKEFPPTKMGAARGPEQH